MHVFALLSLTALHPAVKVALRREQIRLEKTAVDAED
jgi:hypothetical protein